MTAPVAIATPLEDHLTARIAAVPGDEVHTDHDLLPPARYPGDHRGDPGCARYHTSRRG